MKNFNLGFLTTIVLLVVGAIGFSRLGIAEVRADAHDPAWESDLMAFAVRASVKRQAPKVSNPLSHTDGDLIAGGKLYLDDCAGCHGKPGRPLRAHTLFLPPREFAHVGTQFSDSELFWIIKHGIRRTGMSAYGASYSEQQLWTLVEFVRRMKDLPHSVLDTLQPPKP